MTRNQPTALVLGAGIQGVCAALALRSRGYHVILVDEAEGCMTRASGRNEAKIHLGFVYANDDSFRTAGLMLEAALAFAPLLERWIGQPLDWPALRSNAFLYAVMNDSLLSVEQLCAFYARVEDAYARGGGAGVYLGRRPGRLWRPRARERWPAWINPSEVAGLIQTEEVALDLERFRPRMARALEEVDGIDQLFGRRVESAERTPSGFRTEGLTATGDAWSEEADILVNCLWGDRLRLDERLGVTPDRSWVYRLKYRMLGQLPEALAELPSLTFVLGPYGDIATYPNARTYFSWYPACLQGWSDALSPPAAWDSVCAGLMLKEEAKSVEREALAALERIVPGVGASTIEQIDGGVIFSWGKVRQDVGDPHSELHERHAIGVHASDGYFSIDTGKFTCAPLFASRLVDALA